MSTRRDNDGRAPAGSGGGTTRGGDGETIVETRNLSKTYRDFWGRSKKVALKPLDLKIQRGEIFGLLGPNGSGKTTTMKLLLGLIFPTSGDAFIFGREASDVGKNERIGYLPEESYLYKFLDAEETLDFYGRLFDMPPDERKRRADALIEIVEDGMSSEIYELLKRPDELYVVDKAHRRPRFVEDSVREMVAGVIARFPDLPDDAFVSAHQENYETIHTHDVEAERHGLLGEMRAEVAGGAHAHRHITLAEWLGAPA